MFFYGPRRVGLELVKDNQDKPDVVEEIIREQLNHTNNIDHGAGQNTSLMTNIQEIKGYNKYCKILCKRKGKYLFLEMLDHCWKEEEVE